MRKLKLGSLFDGSGGFPLAGVMNGIEPVWASEIEPFPIRVTKQRFPNMKHLGSVTDINGAEIEPVDIITFGSPCQDLSVAGKQAGIHDGERSSLFFEAVRIIREMREHDRAIGRADVDIRPRFAVWENVPGAFSSNKGEDFKAVLQALCEIEGGNGVHVPMSSKGKWFPAGCIVGNGYSIAWRVYDAQYWGVPQRRKRIYLIADFASERAGEILFECEGVSGDHQQGEPAGEGTAEDAEGSTGRGHYACGGIIPYEESYFAWTYRGRENGCNVEMQKDVAYCLREPAGRGSQPNVCYPVAFMGGQGAKARSIAYHDDGTTPTIKSAPSGGNTVPDVCYSINTMVATRHNRDDGRTTFGIGEEGDPQFTLQAAHEHAVCYSIEGNTVDRDTKKNGCGYCQDVSPTLNTQDKHAVTYAIEGNGQRESHKGDGYKETDAMYTLNATEQHAVCMQNTGRGWWNEGDVAETLRTPCGGDATKANLVVTYGVDCRNGTLDEEKTHTVQAHNNGGFSLNCTPSVVYGIDQQGGKGNASYQIDKSPTLCSDSHGTPHAVAFMEAYQHHGWRKSDTAGTLTVGQNNTVRGDTPIVIEDTAEAKHLNVYPIENHPADSRCDLMKGDKCQTLTSRMGTGGNNVPMLLVLNDQGGR